MADEGDVNECTVCLVAFTQDANGRRPVGETLTLECGHELHPNCAMRLFRGQELSPDCPTCRAPPHCTLQYMDVRARACLLERHARKLVSPRASKAVRAVKRARAAAASARGDVTAFKREWKHVLSGMNKLARIKWAATRRLHAAKREMGLLPPQADIREPRFIFKNARLRSFLH